MLNSDALMSLVRELHDVTTLSVYIDGRVADPAKRTRWRTELHNILEAARRTVPDEEKSAFAACESQLTTVLASTRGAIGAPGFVAIISEHQIHFAEPVPTAMPNIALWARGASVTPYVRALSLERPVLAVIGGSREVRLYRWQNGALARLDSVLAKDQLVDGEKADRARTARDSRGHGGTPGDSGGSRGHRNVRGATGTDELERHRDAELKQLIADTVEQVVATVGGTGWVVLGGAKDVVPRMLAALPRTVADRTFVHAKMHSKVTLAEIRDSVEDGATHLRHAREQHLVSEVVQRTHKHASATLGLESTRSAIAKGAVEELLLTESAWHRAPDAVEGVVAGTLNQGGVVEHVEGEAARTLDAEGGGIGALLRFATSSG